MNKFFRGIVSFGRKHDNVLFAIGEIALGTAAVIFAVKNTSEYIEDHSEKPEEDKTAPEKAKDIGKHYWQTGVCLGGFIALRSLDCVYTGEQKREYSKALMACQAALAAKKPKDSKKITQNDSDDEHMQGDMMMDERAEKAYDQYGYQFWFSNDDMPEVEYSVYSDSNCGNKEAFYIPATGRFFISTLTDVNRAEMNCRLQITQGHDLYLNDLYKYLGIGSDGMGHDLYMKADPEGMEDDFCFDLAPGLLDYNDGFGSTDLIYTINPNRFIYNLNLPEELQ